MHEFPHGRHFSDRTPAYKLHSSMNPVLSANLENSTGIPVLAPALYLLRRPIRSFPAVIRWPSRPVDFHVSVPDSMTDAPANTTMIPVTDC